MICIVLLSVYAVAFAQDQERLICPSPRVNAPSEILRPGETARFTVTFDSNKPASNFLKYNWQLSSGRIISGQGTETIDVEPKIHYVRATVRVTGFRGDNDCAHPVEATVRWDVRPSAEKVRAFTKFDGRTVVPLPNDHRLVIFLGLQKNTSEETAGQRETQILEKLEENVDRNQTTIVRVYGGVDITEYWSVPPGAENPTCDRCEPPSKVEEKQECPTISVIGPAGIPTPGEPIEFVASVSADVPKSVQYKWTVSKGQIIDGQGTPRVTVLHPDLEEGLTATIELIGLPKNCPSIASESMAVAVRHLPILIDEFSVPVGQTDLLRLKSAATQQKHNPNNLLYIIEYFDKNTSEFAIRERIRKISEFLTKEMKIDAGFFRIVKQKAAKPLTKIYRLPPGTNTPDPVM